MLTITLSPTIEVLQRRLGDVGARQLPFALAKALTLTAKRIQQQTVAQMRARFDRPTPAVLRSVRVRPAKKSDLSAEVFVRPDPMGKNRFSMAQIIGHQFTGGRRIHKPIEFWLARAGLIGPGEYVVPGEAARLDQYGNMSRGQVQQIMSQLKLGPDARAWASASGRSRRSVRRAGVMFWSRGGHLQRGVWVRDGRSVRPLLLVVRTPQYARRIFLDEIAKDVVSQHFAAEFAAAFRQAMETAR